MRDHLRGRDERRVARPMLRGRLWRLDARDDARPCARGGCVSPEGELCLKALAFRAGAPARATSLRSTSAPSMSGADVPERRPVRRRNRRSLRPMGETSPSAKGG
jgi:hypothetical protein